MKLKQQEVAAWGMGVVLHPHLWRRLSSQAESWRWRACVFPHSFGVGVEVRGGAESLRVCALGLCVVLQVGG